MKVIDSVLVDDQGRRGFADIFDESLLPVAVRDRETLLYANNRWAELHGYEPSEVIGLPWAVLSTEDQEGSFALERRPEQTLYRYATRHKMNQPLHLQVVGNLVSWQGRKAVQETVVSHSKLEETEAFPDVQQRFFEALDGFSEGFALYDEHERLVICNKKFHDMYPTLRDVLVPGRTMEEILRVRVERGMVPQAKGREEAWVEERLLKLRSQGGAYDVLSESGRWLHTRQQLTPDGGTLVTAIDISDRKALEVELARHRDHLEEIVKERTGQLEQSLTKERELNGLQRQFVSMVSHEFRTPLAIIDGTAQRVSRRAAEMTPERLQDALGKIRVSVTRLIGLIESVLDAAHLEEGRVKFDPRECALTNVLSELQSSYIETYPRHRIQMELEGLPPKITADERLLRQIFSNLISNAVKYSAEGSTVHVTSCSPGDQTVQISVRDEGVGIPEAETAKLFERFFRASTSVGIIGTGIGLHLARHFVELHKGSIHVESVEGQGSTFTVQLPITPQ